MSASMVPDPLASPTGVPQSHQLRWAWVSVVLIPVAFALAVVIGEGLATAAGYTPEQTPPLGLSLLIGVPVTLLGMVPAVFAVRFGRRAEAEGHVSGAVAKMLGWVTLAFWTSTFVLSLIARAIS